MQRIAIVDTGMCNVDSMQRAIEECGAKADVTNSPADLDLADKIVLPGVGAFPDAMELLNQSGLADAIRSNVVDHEVPILGVCLGMQLLTTESVEVRPTKGLNLIAGRVERLVPIDRERVPHVGWNEVHRRSDHALFGGVRDATDFYFVHSFHVVCDDRFVIATTPYCGELISVISAEHIMGTQFHPEKSQALGLALLHNFVTL